MLSYTMDVEERSRWIIATPSASQAAQPYFCTEVGDFYAHGRFVTERSGKNSHILFFTLDGAGLVHQGDQDVLLEPGHALLMDCRAPQRYETAPGHGIWYHLWAHVDGPGVALAGKALGLPRLAPVRIGPTRLQPHFDALFRLLGSETAEARARTELAAHGLVAELIAAADAAERTSDAQPVARAVAYIETHLAEKVALEDLARAAALSSSQLIRLFKQKLGTTPHDYLLRRRITRAKELLAETTLTSAVIASQTGFSSESSFSYRFSRMVGQSPRAWRKGSPGIAKP